MDPTARFSSRVENYVKYRPHYPLEIIDILREKCGFTPAWSVADIGSGTGILTELFLKHGNLTFGVEPNGPMREAAERLLSGYPGFTSIAGSAERTALDDACVEMVTAGQAFHWFDQDLARREFRRILKPGGWVILIWNDRRSDATPFMAAFDQLVREYTQESRDVHGTRTDQETLSHLFSPNRYETCHCDNRWDCDFDSLKGGLLSSSYAPEAGHPRHEAMIADLGRVFEQHQTSGQVSMIYDTRIYLGHA